jgi:hypothetical protein
VTTGAQPDDLAIESQKHWRAVRSMLKERRHELAAAAAELYPGMAGVDGTGLLCRPTWLPAEPVELGQIELCWVDDAAPPAITGSDAVASAGLPVDVGGRRFGSYAEAIGALDRPALFENRVIYRLLDAELGDAGGGRLSLTSGRYFDAIGLGEALAHEFAAATLSHGHVTDLDQLPLRAAIGDPCDLSRRPATVGITTLTLRRESSGDATFLLHWRDPAKVTHAPGQYQVMPVGVFQPADDGAGSVREDLNLWRSMVREFSEELLGGSEDYSRFGSPIHYELWDFYRRLTEARQRGDLQVSALGVGVDPLTLVADVLAVAVFDADVFDDIFGGLLAANAEGQIVSENGTEKFVFAEASITRSAGDEKPMQDAGAAVLKLAWSHLQSLAAPMTSNDSSRDPASGRRVPASATTVAASSRAAAGRRTKGQCSARGLNRVRGPRDLPALVDRC